MLLSGVEKLVSEKIEVQFVGTNQDNKISCAKLKTRE